MRLCLLEQEQTLRKSFMADIPDKSNLTFSTPIENAVLQNDSMLPNIGEGHMSSVVKDVENVCDTPKKIIVSCEQIQKTDDLCHSAGIPAEIVRTIEMNSSEEHMNRKSGDSDEIRSECFNGNSSISLDSVSQHLQEPSMQTDASTRDVKNCEMTSFNDSLGTSLTTSEHVDEAVTRSHCSDSQKNESSKLETNNVESSTTSSSSVEHQISVPCVSQEAGAASNIPNDVNANNSNSILGVYDDDSDSSYEFDSEVECDNSENGYVASSFLNTIAKRGNDFKSSRTHRTKAADEYYELQLQMLEENNQKLIREVTELKQNLRSQEAAQKVIENKLKSDYEGKLEKLSISVQASKKDKEAMVVKYANSEKEVIVLKKSISEWERKCKDFNKEKENLSSMVKNLQSDRGKLCATIEQKVTEVNYLQRDYEKLKEEDACKDIKIKWVQNKLKTEMDAHKDTRTKLEQSMHKKQEMREEAEQVRKDCQEMIRRYQEAEEIKSVELDHQLRIKLSELEVQRQERSDQEEVYQILKQELDALKKKQRITIEENNSLTLKIHSLEKERLEYEQTVSKLKENQNTLRQEIVDLTAHLAEMANLKMQLEREKDKYSASVRENERLRLTNAELQRDMDACHMKEGELLEFTEKSTAKAVHLQSEYTRVETKAQALEEEVARLNKLMSEMKQSISTLTISLEEEKQQREDETQLLARKLAEKTKAAEQLTQKLEEADNENSVMKRRHIASIKELSRELAHFRKRIDLCECSASCPSSAAEKTSLGSRASSSASLDNINNVSTNTKSSNSNAVACPPQISPSVAFSGAKIMVPQNSLPFFPIPDEVNKQMLVDRIVRLQKILAKREEKIEFLSDHNTHLVKEMKKKSKIIQNYVVKAEAGALTSSSSDQNKMDLAKRGGIMASVYRSQLSDANMTLELSLEINNKLQAVLEDTLLKNITLKDNINTLGEEIARLTSEINELSREIAKAKNGK